MTKKIDYFVNNIFESIEKIKTFTKDISYKEFENDEMRHLAVIHLIEIIGEATVHLEEGFKKDNPKIPWTKIKNMRNFLIHEYWQVSIEDVWETVQTHIPELKRLLSDAIKK